MVELILSTIDGSIPQTTLISGLLAEDDGNITVNPLTLAGTEDYPRHCPDLFNLRCPDLLNLRRPSSCRKNHKKERKRPRRLHLHRRDQYHHRLECLRPTRP